MKWPIFRSCDQSCSNRILENVIPFLTVVFIAAQLRIPKVALPNWVLNRSWPVFGRDIFPVTNPLLQRFRRHRCRRAKEMNVVRHDHISTNKPSLGVCRCVLENGDDIGGCEDSFPIFAARCQKNDDWFVVAFDERVMRRMSTTRLVHGGETIQFGRRRRGRPPTFSRLLRVVGKRRRAFPTAHRERG